MNTVYSGGSQGEGEALAARRAAPGIEKCGSFWARVAAPPLALPCRALAPSSGRSSRGSALALLVALLIVFTPTGSF